MECKHIEYLNPNKLAVEKLVLTVTNAGVVQNIKALDPYWVEKKVLIYYERPPSSSEMILGAVDSWKSKMEVYIQNLKWILGLEHHRFWSVILFHPNCLDALISFLQEASPPYELPSKINDVKIIYEEIRRLVLVIFSRLITNKESETRWMSKEYMADILYNNFIFTIPVLWDICLAYGADNMRHVSRLLDAVFSLQPQYTRDAEQALCFVQEAFKYIILQVNKDFESEEPPNLPETFKGFSEIRRPTDSKNKETLSLNTLKDLVLHLLDTAMTLRIFVEVYPNAVEMFKNTNFVLSIVQLYEYGIPQLYEKLQELGEESVSLEVEGYLDLARSELIDLFKEILAVYKNAIFNHNESNSASSLSTYVESYLALMLDALSERLFIKDYHKSYPVNDDLEMLKVVYPDIDTVKTDFILQAIYSNLDEDVPEEVKQIDRLTNGHIESIEDIPSTSKESDIPDNIKQESLISEVKDILPHLGDGFILKCLEHYGFNSERVINSVLEDTLAQPLRALDTNLPIIPEDPLDRKFLETGIQRLNVFDGDEFDIMTRDDVDLSKIHIGKKKEKYKDLKDMLNDKTEVKSRVDIYSKYNLVCDDLAMYSDEYDDTYDSDGVVPAADVEDPRRPFVTPRALMSRHRPEESEEESVSEQEEKPELGSSSSRVSFCVNPEEVRARRAAQARGRARAHAHPRTQRNVDVVGKPKGQGQDKEVLQNRDRKEKGKGFRANHNRRQGAQWKRSQGMMPS